MATNQTPIGNERKTILRRQGDILFKPINEIPNHVKEMEGNIVAHGESGNLHQTKGGQVQLYQFKKNPNDLFSTIPEHLKQMENQVVKDPLQVDYLEVKADTLLVHEEHNQIPLPAGKYAVVHEREYDPFAEEGQQIRQVID